MRKNLIVMLTFVLILSISCVPSPNIGDNIIDKIPVFSGPTEIVGGKSLSKISRIIINSDDAQNPSDVITDIFYTLLTPPLTKFKTIPGGLTENQSLVVDFLGKPVELKITIEDQVIRYLGIIIEKNTEDNDVQTGKIDIKYYKNSSTFDYYSEMLVFNENLGGFYVFHEILEAEINDDSFIAPFTTSAYLASGGVQIIEDGEIYSGPLKNEDSDWITGFAFPSFYNHKDPFADPLVFITETGVPIQEDTFNEFKEKLEGLFEDFDTTEGKRGNPYIGYRKFKNENKNSTAIFNGMEKINDEDDGNTDVRCNFIGSMTGLEDSQILSYDGAPLEFDCDWSDSANPPVMVLNSDNLDTLISGLPSKDWRIRTKLKDILK